MNVKTWKDLKVKDTQDLFSFTAILDDRGRIVVPASIRKRLRIKFGSLIFTVIDPEKIQRVIKEAIERIEE